MKKIIAISLACFFYATSSFGLTLDFYHLWPKGGPSMVDEILWDATKQFEEENPGITINWMEDGHDQWAIKSKAMYTSGDVPHVMATQPADFDAFKEQKMFIKLNDLIDNDPDWGVIPGSYKTIYDPEDGGIYGIAFSGYFEFVYYNQRLFDENGLEYPKTWDELLNVVDTFVAAGIIPFATAGKDAWPISIQSHYLMDREMGFDYFYDSLKSGKRENTWDNPGYISAFDRLAELGKRGAFGDDVLSLGYGDAGNLFYTEQAAMYLQGSWEINGISDLDIADNIQVGNYVSIPGGKGDQTAVTRGYGKSFAVASGLPEEEEKAAIKFLKHITSKEVALAMYEAGGELTGTNLPDGATPKAKRLMTAHFDVFNAAGSSWAAYGEFTLPKMYAEWDRVGQQLVAGQIDGKAAAKYLEEQRLKIHYGE